MSPAIQGVGITCHYHVNRTPLAEKASARSFLRGTEELGKVNLGKVELKRKKPVELN